MALEMKHIMESNLKKSKLALYKPFISLSQSFKTANQNYLVF